MIAGGFVYGLYKLVDKDPTQAFDMDLTEELHVWAKNKAVRFGLIGESTKLDGDATKDLSEKES